MFLCDRRAQQRIRFRWWLHQVDITYLFSITESFSFRARMHNCPHLDEI